MSLAVLDIEPFKQITDTGGHEAGDEMLLAVARCLTELARCEDTLARGGGDELVWILPETTWEQALVAVERARSKAPRGGVGRVRRNDRESARDASSDGQCRQLRHGGDQQADGAPAFRGRRAVGEQGQTAAINAGSTTRRRSRSTQRRRAPSGSSGRKRSSGCVPCRERSMPGTRSPASTQSVWRACGASGRADRRGCPHERAGGLDSRTPRAPRARSPMPGR
ncbi:MAG: GGDEF domain-containing protein [Solirubrobacteraceae bacterium]